MKIGTMEFDRPVMLAPMAGVTDLPYRLICKEMGCDYMVTEMVSAKAVLYNNKNTDILLQTLPEEAPSALQLLDLFLYSGLLCNPANNFCFCHI